MTEYFFYEGIITSTCSTEIPKQI